EQLVVLYHLDHAGGAQGVAPPFEAAGQVGGECPFLAGQAVVQQAVDQPGAGEESQVHHVDRTEAVERVVHVDVQGAGQLPDVAESGHAVGLGGGADRGRERVEVITVGNGRDIGGTAQAGHQY